MFKEQNPALTNDQALMKLVTEDPLPKVTSPEKFPVYAKLEPFLRNVKGMKKGSEISSYAKLHWDDFKSQGSPDFGFKYMVAINETLAEVARLDAGGYLPPNAKLPGPWLDFYKTVQSIFKNKK